MKQQLFTAPVVFESTISLKKLVSNLVSNSLPIAHYHNTNVVNEIKSEIRLGTDLGKAISVMRELLNTVVTNSRNGEIHVTAECFDDMFIFEIQERNNYNGYALAYSIGSLEPDAASLGGHITIKGPRQKIATISFCFPHQQAA